MMLGGVETISALISFVGVVVSWWTWLLAYWLYDTEKGTSCCMWYGGVAAAGSLLLLPGFVGWVNPVASGLGVAQRLLVVE